MKSSPFYFCFSVLNSVPLDNLKSEASVKEYLLSCQWFNLHVHSISFIVPVLSCLFLLSSFTLALAIGCSIRIRIRIFFIGIMTCFSSVCHVTRPPSTIYACVNRSVVCDRCTRGQGHSRNLFRRRFSGFCLKHHTWPYTRQSTLVYGGKLPFSNAAVKISKTISRKRHDGFSFLNDGNLDKCLSKKKIRHTTPALWLSSPHWAKCMTNSYPLRSPSRRHAKLHSYVGASSREWVYFSDIHACAAMIFFLRFFFFSDWKPAKPVK